jgi:anthranilate/para-aminobenzoate synthase component I
MSNVRVRAHRVWAGISLGAGGAVTWLSDRDKEWSEVLTKVRSVVGEVEADR